MVSIMFILKMVFQGSQTGEMIKYENDLKREDKKECEQFFSQPAKPWWSGKERTQWSFDDENYDIVRCLRERAPANYSMKIESFSSVKEKFGLSKTSSKFESTEFRAGGHNWVLSVYPCGNKKENGHGHLSFYLKIVDKLNSAMVIYAMYKFFVYDQIHDKYLTIQDLSERRFHALKTEWGISKALKLTTFSDPANGFLINDSCIFGVEVYIMDSAHAAGALSMVKKFHSRSFTWEIKKFSKLKEQDVWSPIFSIEGWSWKFLLHPKGRDTETGKSLGLFLQLDDVSALTNGDKLYVKVQLSVKNQSGGKDYNLTTDQIYFSASSYRRWGYVNFMALSDLHDLRKGFKVKDQVMIEVDIIDIFRVKGV